MVTWLDLNHFKLHPLYVVLCTIVNSMLFVELILNFSFSVELVLNSFSIVYFLKIHIHVSYICTKWMGKWVRHMCTCSFFWFSFHFFYLPHWLHIFLKLRFVSFSWWIYVSIDIDTVINTVVILSSLTLIHCQTFVTFLFFHFKAEE